MSEEDRNLGKTIWPEFTQPGHAKLGSDHGFTSLSDQGRYIQASVPLTQQAYVYFSGL